VYGRTLADTGHTQARSIAGPSRRHFRHRGEDGVALIEFTLVLLPLVMIVFGSIDLGRAFMALTQLRNAAQSGASYARSFPTQVSNTGNCVDPNNVLFQVAQEQGANSSGSGALTALGYTVTVTDQTTSSTVTGCQTATVKSGDEVQVMVAKTFRPITWPLSSLIGTVTLHGTSQVVVP